MELSEVIASFKELTAVNGHQSYLYTDLGLLSVNSLSGVAAITPVNFR